MVGIVGADGAGATTLLQRLRENAAEHGFRDGAFLLADVRGPFSDVACRLRAMAELNPLAGKYSQPRLDERTAGRHALILLDNARLSTRDLAELVELFPTYRFVVAGADAGDYPSISLGPLQDDTVRALLIDTYQRPIDTDNDRFALALCAGLGSLPRQCRLIGLAARFTGSSFISLHVNYGSGENIIRGYIDRLPVAQRRILAVFAQSRAPLAAHHLAYILRTGEIMMDLDELIACELVERYGNDMYDVPRSVRPYVSVPDDHGQVHSRILETLRDALYSWPVVPLHERQIHAVHEVVETASKDFAWHDVLAAGPKLAEVLSTSRRFAACNHVRAQIKHAAEQLAILDPRATLLSDSRPFKASETAVARMPNSAGASNETPSHKRSKLQPVALVGLAAFIAGVSIVGNRQNTALSALAMSRSWISSAGSTSLRAAGLRDAQPSDDERLMSGSIDRFNASPTVVIRGQTASLCVGIERPARGFVTHVGPLEPGITRCYHVGPHRTTTYRLYVTLRAATATRAVTVAVLAGHPARIVAANDRR